MIKQWITAQVGAREHYAIARALHRAGLLKHMFTDLWVSERQANCPWAYCPTSTRRALSRSHPDIPNHLVTAFPWLALMHAARQRTQTGTRASTYQEYVRTGRRFSERVSKSLPLAAAGERIGFFGYTNASLEVMQALDRCGVPSILSQIDAAKAHENVLSEEVAKWPSWGKDATGPPNYYWERIEQEWSLARLVVVNSEWTRLSLIDQGLEAEKIAVLPLAYELASNAIADSRRPLGTSNPLEVLFLGRVTLSKGVQYLLAAADILRGEPVRFTIAGPLGECPRAVIDQPRRNVRWLGSVPRTEVSDLYAAADLFVFPSLSDGFGITQLEAMSHGLPVITTNRCGEVVTHGEDGALVPAADAEGLAAAIVDIASSEKLVPMGENARAKARLFGMDTYVERLLPLLELSQNRGTG